jgi:integrase/recombinase XerD
MEKSTTGPGRLGVVVTTPSHLRLAVAAYLARFNASPGFTPIRTFGGYLTWCELRGLDPLSASWPPIELSVRWLQEAHVPALDGVPADVGRGRLLRTCVIHGVLEHSLAEYVRRPNVPAESRRSADSSAVRGPADHRQTVGELVRLRPGHDARTLGPSHLRGHWQKHRGPWP